MKSYVTIDRDSEDIYQSQQTFNLEVKRAQMSNVILLSGAEISHLPPKSVKNAGNAKMKGKQTLTIGGEDCGKENVILFNGLRIDSRYPPTIMQVQTWRRFAPQNMSHFIFIYLTSPFHVKYIICSLLLMI